MELVVNTNRIVAALVKEGKSRQIILSNRFELYTVDFGIEEVRKYKETIIKKAHITDKEFDFLMKQLLSKIAVLSEAEISKDNIRKALEIMKEIDVNDVPFIALSMQLGNKPIWSDDKHFKQQKKVKVLTTSELGKLL